MERLNISITVNMSCSWYNEVHIDIFSHVAEEGSLKDKLTCPVDGSGWGGFRIFYAIVLVAAVLLALVAFISFVIRKGSCNCDSIGEGCVLPQDTNVVARLYQNNGAQILRRAIYAVGDIKGPANGSLIFMKEWINVVNPK